MSHPLNVQSSLLVQWNSHQYFICTPFRLIVVRLVALCVVCWSQPGITSWITNPQPGKCSTSALISTRAGVRWYVYDRSAILSSTRRGVLVTLALDWNVPSPTVDMSSTGSLLSPWETYRRSRFCLSVRKIRGTNPCCTRAVTSAFTIRPDPTRLDP